MDFERIYPLELEQSVVQDYENHAGGYKTLAKKYRVTRDLVRFWILKRKRVPKRHHREKVMPEKRGKTEQEKEIEFLRLQVNYYKRYAEILEATCTDVKKKRAAKRYRDVYKKELQ